MGTVIDADPAQAPRSITILGSTGSIGCSTVDLITRNASAFRVEALTGNRNIALLAQQARKLQPALAVTADPDLYDDLKSALSGTGIAVAAGPRAVAEAAARPSQWVMAAIVGAAGLEPTLEAVRRGAVIGLANKESLVCAGQLMTAEVKRHGAVLLPVDSEHNAIFQVFDFDNPDTVERIILTASGGPFRQWTLEAMAAVTPEQAVAHPNWSMGAKISIDSATMMNKGLEMIEAYHLFPVSVDQIEVLVHPQSVVHSLVGYTDGSVLAQLGAPDMRTPIAHALAWPHRMETPVDRLDLAQIGTLAFEAPDLERFPALGLAREVLERQGGAPTVLNAANEEAVSGFLAGKIGFLDIVKTVERCLQLVEHGALTSLDELFELDREARGVARSLLGD